jgi:hypothetical protein
VSPRAVRDRLVCRKLRSRHVHQRAERTTVTRTEGSSSDGKRDETW